MKANMGKKQSYKNIAMNVFAFVVQFFISFYISPLIVSKVGASAYGFIGLANDFVSYAAIIATVFNSVASRFIANSFYKKDYETANYYFNSLIAANIAISAVLGLAGVLLVPNLDKVLSIPTSLVFDVKLTFALIFGSYIISLLTLVFTTSTFVTNRTDIQGIRNIIQYLIRFALVVVFLNLISVRIYWVALATLIATAVISIMNMSLTKRLTPELKIDPSKAKRKYAVELAKSGSWMALTSISTVLLRGLDLTVANIFVGDYEMGLLSIARTIPNNVTSVIATIAPIFTPVFIAYYAQDNITGLTSNVKKTINTMALILFVPISGFIVFSYDFYGSLFERMFSSQIFKNPGCRGCKDHFAEQAEISFCDFWNAEERKTESEGNSCVIIRSARADEYFNKMQKLGFIEVVRDLDEKEVADTQMHALKAKKGKLHSSIRYHVFTKAIDYVFAHNLYERLGIREYNYFCKFYRKLCEKQKL